MPKLRHVRITSHRRALPRPQLQDCEARTVKPARPSRKEQRCCLWPGGSVEDELHILTRIHGLGGRVQAA